jgi:uncharacterized protein YjcR
VSKYGKAKLRNLIKMFSTGALNKDIAAVYGVSSQRVSQWFMAFMEEKVAPNLEVEAELRRRRTFTR